MTEGNPSRAEFDMLRQLVTDNGRRIDAIDQSGTRGVSVVQVQLTDLAKDVSALATRLDRHDEEHEKEARERAAGRRWIIATIIAFLAAVEVPLGWLIAHVHP